MQDLKSVKQDATTKAATQIATKEALLTNPDPGAEVSKYFFDIEKLIRTDPIFRAKLEKSVKNVIATSEALHKKNDTKSKQIHNEALMDYLKLTRFHLSPLLGYYYPTYPMGTPFSLKNFPFAHIFYSFNVGAGCFTVYRGSRQISKCVDGRTICKFRHKPSGKIIEMPIQEFYKMCKPQ